MITYRELLVCPCCTPSWIMVYSIYDRLLCTTQMAQFSTSNTLFPHSTIVYSFSVMLCCCYCSKIGFLSTRMCIAYCSSDEYVPWVLYCELLAHYLLQEHNMTNTFGFMKKHWEEITFGYNKQTDFVSWLTKHVENCASLGSTQQAIIYTIHHNPRRCATRTY